jgi:RNA polymerase sigma-70 factor (ECF subfamily)
MHEASTTPHDVLAQMGWVRELARGLVRSAADADDVAQDVWLAASKEPPRSSTSMRAWLTRITRNVALSRTRSELRRRERETYVARSERQGGDDDVLVRGETCQRVVAAVMALDEPHRSTVLHRYLDDWSIAQIAARDGIDEVAVRKRLSRALQKLRAALDADFDGGREAWMVALLDVARTGRWSAARPIAIAGGLIAMKKALVIVGLIVLIVCGLWLTPVRHWILENRTVSPSSAIASELQVDHRTEPSVQAGAQVAENRAAIVEESKADSLSIDGVVLNLAFPDPSLQPTPAIGVTLKLSIPFAHPSGPAPTETKTDSNGAFHIELHGVNEKNWRTAALHIDGDERYRPKSVNLFIKRGPNSIRPEIVTLTPSPQIDITPGVPRSGVRIERSAHGDVAGIVVGDDERPLSGVAVRLGGAAFFGTDAPPEESNPEVITDANGAFVFQCVHAAKGFYPGTPLVTAASPGLRIIPCGSPSLLPNGGWSNVRIRMTASGGRVVLRVHDSSGTPEVGVRISLGISNAEPGAHWEPSSSGASTSPIQGVSDSEGRVVLEDVWVGKRLEVRLAKPHEEWTRRRATGGRIDLDHSELGEPIVVPSSKLLELEVVMPRMIRLRGRVVDSQGAVVPAANIALRVSGPRTDGEIREASATARNDGSFELAFRRPLRSLGLELSAYTGPKSQGNRLEHLDEAGPRMVARQRLTIAPDAPDDTFVELTVVPGLAISGRVTESDDSPCAGSIAAIPSGSDESQYVSGVAQALDERGQFEITNLLPGTYDLEVQPNRAMEFSGCLQPQRFTGIQAGDTGLGLVLGENHPVNVEVEVKPPDGKLAGMIVVTGIFYPSAPLKAVGEATDHERTFAGTSGWPRGATFGFGGQGWVQDAEGTTDLLLLNGEVPLHRLRPMSEGWYCLGIDAVDTDGLHYHACGTGLLYLRPGNYHFHFDLVRQTSIEGRIPNADPESDLWVSLVTREGKPVQVQCRSRHMDDFVPVGSSGRFAIDGAPVGEFRLRVGAEQQLRGGEFIQEVPVTIAATNNAPLEIRLP